MRRGFRIVACALTILLAAAVGGSAAFADNYDPFQLRLGVYPVEEADAGVCVVRAPATVRRCTLAQLDPKFEYAGGLEKKVEVSGRILRFRVKPGIPSPHTTSVEARFRVLKGSLRAGGPAGPWQRLLLDGQKALEFPVHGVPFGPADQIALDVIVHGDGFGAAVAPLGVRWEGGGDGIAQWTPPLTTGERRFHVREDMVLSLGALYERNDRTAPRLHVTYARRQDFLRKRLVYVDVRSNEAARVEPRGLVTLPASGPYASYGFDSEPSLHLRPRVERRVAFRVPPFAVHAANEALRRGDPAVFDFEFAAVDTAGNKRRTKSMEVLPARR